MRPLEQLRAALGVPPREASAVLERPPPPAWMPRRDGLRTLWDRHEGLVANGEVVWGHLFMANSALFGPGDDDVPAGVVYSFDPIYDRHPEWLVPIGSRLYDFHEGEAEVDVDPLAPSPLAPTVANLRHALRSGFERDRGVRVPRELAGGRVVFMSAILVHRDHLPGGYLRSMRVPLLVERRFDDPALMIVPEELWPAPLLAADAAGS